MNRKNIAAIAGAALLAGLTCTAGGCGSTAGKTAAAAGCSFDTFMQAPTHRQIVTTSSVSCAGLIEEATTTLVVQGRKTGEGAGAWDNFDDPKRTVAVPPNSLTYTVTCIGGYDYQASADITGTFTDGKPFHYHETTPVASYTAADCAQD